MMIRGVPMLLLVSLVAALATRCAIPNEGCSEEPSAAGECPTQGVTSGSVISDSLPIFIEVDPNGTYLTVVEPGTAPNPPTNVSITTLGVEGGTLIYMAYLGDFSPYPGQPENIGGTFAIFVDDDGASYPPGAGSVENMGEDTGLTCPSNLDTDIPNDFIVPADKVEVPSSATRILFHPYDCNLGDNEDLDGDYGVLIDLWDGN